MPRKPRMYLTGVPSHVVQRGNNREACFFADEDYLFYLDCLKDACLRYGVSLHAYVLMANHVHLLMTPNDERGISKVMQSLGRRYVQYINHNYRRTGTLWEGRHKSSLVDAEHYLMACYRYIELNPVRAGMVLDPLDYRWSSHSFNVTGSKSPLLTGLVSPHAIYIQLGNSDAERYQYYRELFATELTDAVVNNIRQLSKFSMPIGNNRFHQQIERALGRKIGQAYRGRPLKKNASQLSPTP